MTLVDSSVWIDHWRKGNARLATALAAGRVLSHPFVIGELACGNLPERPRTLRWLSLLPALTVAHHTEVMTLIDARRLAGLGLGWVDVHLLAAARLGDVPLWTLDRALRRAAEALGVFGEGEA